MAETGEGVRGEDPSLGGAAKAALLFAPALAWGLFAAWRLAAAEAPPEPGTVDRGAATVVGSRDCARCHPQQHESWRGSWHRSMTQPVDRAELLGPFDGESYAYGGFRARMYRNAQGTPMIEVIEDAGAGEPVARAEVVYTVGSHRYQQYVGRLEVVPEGLEPAPGALYRLPVAWHRAEARWIHLNGAFVEPEGIDGDAESWFRHLGRWNDNCAFCHNTEPVPGLDAGRFETRVGEVGIACEACHGKGSFHVARNADPFVRMRAGDAPDGSIAHPGALPSARENEVCGRCHGNRIGHDIRRILREGDGFVPGTDLASVSRPIWPDATLNGTEETPFAPRFWPDGRPRLSAYEYQAQLTSACSKLGDIRCGDCHTMHGETPDMQLREGPRDAACRRCHSIDEGTALSGANGPGGHGAHLRVELSGAPDCLDCHMPRVTYGLLEGMITHHIGIPEPQRWVGRDDQPDACTQCHVDRTRAWAASAMPALARGELQARPMPGVPRVYADLLGGDPLQRNLAAHVMARPESVGASSYRLAALIDALDDSYPSVRWFAWRGARALAQRAGRGELTDGLREFDYLAPAETRVEAVEALRELMGAEMSALPLADDPEAKAALETGADDVALWIGE